ncbi:hypothetical protein AB0A60_07140 [Streptomyces sp. NPDC046275]|uniref:hypothetical protein n=1 Tax=Streptomyces sp. NPDC046275 TaxID=3157201 RepID=UPI0033ED421B
MHIRAPHIAEWLADHEHWVLDVGYSREFDRLLGEFPWAPSRLRWSNVPHVRIYLPEEDGTPNDFWERFCETPAGRHEYIFLMYSAKEPGIVCRTRDAILDLDLLYSSAPGARYFCGAEAEKGIPVPRFMDFAEYDGLDLVTAYFPAERNKNEPYVHD